MLPFMTLLAENQMPGNKHAMAGNILTVFVDDPDNPSNQRFSILVVLKTFNLSFEMAEYYHTSPPSVKAFPSEQAMDRFYLHLMKKGLVERPLNEVVHIGSHGRPPKEIIDEYKYSINPIEAMLSILQEKMVNKSKVFVNHQGYRIMVLDQMKSLSEVLVEIMHHDLSLGLLSVGVVFDRTLDAVLNDDDLMTIRSIIEEMVCIKQQPEGICIGRMFVHLMPLVK
jgi:hypothetical protein